MKSVSNNESNNPCGVWSAAPPTLQELALEKLPLDAYVGRLVNRSLHPAEQRLVSPPVPITLDSSDASLPTQQFCRSVHDLSLALGREARLQAALVGHILEAENTTTDTAAAEAELAALAERQTARRALLASIRGPERLAAALVIAATEYADLILSSLTGSQFRNLWAADEVARALNPWMQHTKLEEKASQAGVTVRDHRGETWRRIELLRPKRQINFRVPFRINDSASRAAVAEQIARRILNNATSASRGLGLSNAEIAESSAS